MAGMIEDINIRQAAVADLLAGDDKHLDALITFYSYIAEESARFIHFTRGVQSIPFEDVLQQAYLILISDLSSLNGEHLTDINRPKDYPEHLALRPYLICRVKNELKKFYIQRNSIIRIPHTRLQKDKIKEKGEIKFSVISLHQEDYDIPIESQESTSEELVILKEVIERLRLTYIESQILKLKQQGYTFKVMSQKLNKSVASIQYHLHKIGQKWVNANS